LIGAFGDDSLPSWARLEGDSMRPKERRDSGQNDIFRARLDPIVDMGHPLVALSIDWRFLEERFGAVYSDKPGHPRLPTRLMAGLSILKHTHNLSDGEPRRDLAGFALKLLLFKSVDEFDGGEEPDALAVMLDGLDADRCGEMGLPRAGAADQDDIVASSGNSHRWSWRNSASLTSLLAKSKPVRSR
jgi:hypothetical protein